MLRVTETILEAIIMHQPEIDGNGKVNIVIKVAFVIDEIPVTLLVLQIGAHSIYRCVQRSNSIQLHL